MTTMIRTAPDEALRLLGAIEDPWHFEGTNGNGNANQIVLRLYLDDASTGNLLVLRSDRTWEFKLEVAL